MAMKQELMRNGFAEERIEIHPPATNVDNAAEGSTFSNRNLIVQFARYEDLFARVAGETQEQLVSGKGVC